MSIFNRGGRRVDVIKYGGTNSELIWRYPSEDFNTHTQLIVAPSQEAIFIKGGQVLGHFREGTYTLDTNNYPFLRALVNKITGGVSPFSCVVYYVNKVVSMNILWGTDSPISIVDPVYGVPVDIRSNGTFDVQVSNGQKLMEKLVGQTQGYRQEDIMRYFSGVMAMYVRTVISGTMAEKGLSPIGVDAHLPEMSQEALRRLAPQFEEYGLELKQFTIKEIAAPDLDEIKRTALDTRRKDMLTDHDVADKRKWASAQAYENDVLNVTEQQKMASRIGDQLSRNSSPNVSGAAAGLFGSTSVRSSAERAADVAQGLLDSTPRRSASTDEFEERVRKLRMLLDNGMITQAMYEKKLSELMDDI